MKRSKRQSPRGSRFLIVAAALDFRTTRILFAFPGKSRSLTLIRKHGGWVRDDRARGYRAQIVSWDEQAQ